jgi:geranylgeranyl diphosphate synthase, type I
VVLLDEHEVCPVYLAVAAEDDVHPDLREVAEYRWASWDALGLVVTNAPWLLSPWAGEQIAIVRKRQAPASGVSRGNQPRPSGR